MSVDLWEYTSDDGNTYLLKLGSEVAAQGGFTGPAVVGAAPMYPYNHRDMRHVCGKSGDGKHATLPIAEVTNTKFTVGGNFTLHGVTFDIQSQIGERRDYRHIGG